jgi:DNA repair exonuclease SbcCD ATPase subunit
VITLKKLKWNNCFSYGEDNILDLNDSTVTQLVGTNGAGKSSIPLILEEVLFNKNSKGIKKADIANRINNKGYDISLDFDVNGDEYKIEVNRRASIKCKLFKNGEDISSHTATNTYKTVEEVLGLDFKTFTQIVYQNTNTSLQFLTATDTNRKKFLIDLLQLEKYVDYFEIFKEKSRVLSGEVSHIQGKLDTIIKWLDDNNLEAPTILPKLDLPKISENDLEQLSSLQLEFKNISEINRKINQNNFYKTELATIDLSKYKNEGNHLLESRQNYDKDLEELGKWQSVYNSEVFEGTSEDICPTCGQEVDQDLLDEIYQREEEKHNQAFYYIKKIQDTIRHKKKVNEQIDEKQKEERRWKELFNSIDQTLPAQIKDADELQRKIEMLAEKIDNEQKELEYVINENESRERHNTRLQVIQEQIGEFKEELKTHENKLEEVKDMLGSIDILKKAFSTNGLLAYKIENLVKDLEELTNEYLAELSDGRFNLQFVVLNDKLNVEIDDNGKAVEILALSAGELARVNTSTLLAIRKLMSSISKSRINVLFLDEVTNVLDEVGKEKMVEILLGEENLNTYIVSHGWTHPLLSKIEVIKENEISRLDG